MSTTTLPRQRGSLKAGFQTPSASRAAARFDHPAAGLRTAPEGRETRVLAPDPPPSRDHLPPVRVAPEEFDDADQSPPARVPVVVHADESITDACPGHEPIRRLIAAPRSFVIPKELLYP